MDHYHRPYYYCYYFPCYHDYTKPAHRRLCTLTFSRSVFVGFRCSPRSDEKRLTSRDSVANSSFAYSSQLVNNWLVCKYVMRTEPIHIKKSVWLWGFRHVNFRPATRSFQSLSNHTHKLARYRCSQYVTPSKLKCGVPIWDIQLLYLALAKTLVIATNLDLCLC